MTTTVIVGLVLTVLIIILAFYLHDEDFSKWVK